MSNQDNENAVGPPAVHDDEEREEEMEDEEMEEDEEAEDEEAEDEEAEEGEGGDGDGAEGDDHSESSSMEDHDEPVEERIQRLYTVDEIPSEYNQLQVEMIKRQLREKCGICMEEKMIQPAIFPACAHVFCGICAINALVLLDLPEE
ncbi:uncharacterized protein RCC_08867 [Ramularia collo-cygni]|uniref:Uncharacterized protein n=1 Tax=Ramularia collo-cygni TaxID=112498 RepID=A0A2D3UYK2_9PEZI|nr:uncharacterized protein RCC_08867 [Ramularia collo-cygni]CZT23157.1 uncharacterized protein RCC_08867 [Ramularia collo-cygni]